jgi:C4-dicarboxylate-specific signal transduction histidine kinase
MIRADRAEMRQIILNLVINALDAVTRTEKKEIQVHLTIKKSEICLTVSDTGSGMDEFTVNNMYTPFFSKKQGGTGLGLAVVRRIVEEYSGEIECRSRPGEGTTFTITLKGILIS